MRFLIIIFLLTNCAPSVNIAMVGDINNAVNKVPYVSDMDNYGVSDYHAEPSEFYAKGGDCEDYARAKYEKLKDAGLIDQQMAYISARTPHYITHAMLGVKSRSGWLVLDNNSDKLEDEAYLVKKYRDAYFIPVREFK